MGSGGNESTWSGCVSVALACVAVRSRSRLRDDAATVVEAPAAAIQGSGALGRWRSSGPAEGRAMRLRRNGASSGVVPVPEARAIASGAKLGAPTSVGETGGRAKGGSGGTTTGGSGGTTAGGSGSCGGVGGVTSGGSGGTMSGGVGEMGEMRPPDSGGLIEIDGAKGTVEVAQFVSMFQVQIHPGMPVSIVCVVSEPVISPQVQVQFQIQDEGRLGASAVPCAGCVAAGA